MLAEDMFKEEFRIEEVAQFRADETKPLRKALSLGEATRRELAAGKERKQNFLRTQLLSLPTL